MVNLGMIDRELNTYDESTEKALKKFQEFYHLPATGLLDEATIALMEKPRCGVPDFRINLANDIWVKTDLTYCFKNYTNDIPPNEVRKAIAKAFSLWSAVTPLTFRRVHCNANADITILFTSGVHDDAYEGFRDFGEAVAHAFYPGSDAIAGDIHFDEEETWTVTDTPGVDLFKIAAHEIGHSLGLDHSGDEDSIMRSQVTARSLNSKDISKIRSLYGYLAYAKGDGIGGYDLKSPIDRAFAFDYDHSGKLDHIALYRPGKGTFYILKNSGGAFSPVYAQGEPGLGFKGYDLKSDSDRAFALDYDHSGKLDHIALYRPGKGTFWIIA